MAFLWQNGGTTFLPGGGYGSSGGWVDTTATAINESGLVVGSQRVEPAGPTAVMWEIGVIKQPPTQNPAERVQLTSRE